MPKRADLNWVLKRRQHRMRLFAPWHLKQLSKLIGNVEDPRTRKPSYDLFVTVENFDHCGFQTSSEDDSFQHRPQKLRLPRFSWKMKPWLKFCLVADLVFKTLLSESFWSDATFQGSFHEGMIFFIPLCIFLSSIATSFWAQSHPVGFFFKLWS